MNTLKKYIIGGLLILVGLVSAGSVGSSGQPSPNLGLILKESWDHYKQYKIDQTTGRPLAATDGQDVACGGIDAELTFSESVSYVLYRAVLINDRATFDKTWEWAANNMQRCNLREVFDWKKQAWVPVPENKRDHLFAWRYTPNINRQGRGGVIYYFWTPENDKKLWRDGLDVAPDGDQLIAGALILAHYRWGAGDGLFNYKWQADQIISDLWEKCVQKIEPGQINCCNPIGQDAWFRYCQRGGELLDNHTCQGIALKIRDATYAGIGRVIGASDLSGVKELVVKISGTGFFRVALEDTLGQKYFSKRVAVTNPELQTEYKIPLQQFATSGKVDLTKIKNIILEFSNGDYLLVDLRFNTAESLPVGRYHLLSNDKGMPWINVSYYMPFLYPLFGEVDKDHPWAELTPAAYEDIQASLYAKLKNDRQESFDGTGALPPNWFSIGLLGEITDLPWAVDGTIDDYMSGWDSFRVWYFIAADKIFHGNSAADYLLKGKPYQFLKAQLDKAGYLRVGYTISGEIRNVNWVDQNSCGANGAYLAFFQAAGDEVSKQKILSYLMKEYKKGYWENDPKEYYKQNWAWLGMSIANFQDQENLIAKTLETIRREVAVNKQVKISAIKDFP